MNPFAVLGLDARFDLDPQAIERAYFEKSKELHPDRFATAPAAERVAVLQRSRDLNDAYQIVKRPVPRAEELLAQAGVTIGDNEQLDAEFLHDILEQREELAEARAKGDLPTLERLCTLMTRRRAAAVAELGPLFTAGDTGGIKRTLILLRYLDRYLEECDAALDPQQD
jgi:molecular chaperone HscB